MVLNKKGVSLLRIIVGFIALLLYGYMLPSIDSVLDIAVPSLTGMVKWVVQLFPIAFLIVIILFAFKGDDSGYY